jgi:hypothetical protein
MHNRPLHLPWADVAEVVLFRQYAGLTSVPYVGLRLRPGVRGPTPPPSTAAGAAGGSTAAWSPTSPSPSWSAAAPSPAGTSTSAASSRRPPRSPPTSGYFTWTATARCAPSRCPPIVRPAFVATSQEPVGAVDVRLIGLNRPCILIETYREGALVAEAVYEQGGGHRDAGERRARYLARVHTEGRRLFTASEVLARPHWQRSTDSSGPAPNRSATRSPTMTCGSRRARPRTGSPWPRSTGGTSRRSRPSG